MRAIKIPADTSEELTIVDIPTEFELLNELVGGFVETVYIAAWWHTVTDLTWLPVLLVDEEGLLKKLPVNPRASALFSNFTFNDFLVGDAYMVQLVFTLSGSEFGSIPDDFTIEELRHMTKERL